MDEREQDQRRDQQAEAAEVKEQAGDQQREPRYLYFYYLTPHSKTTRHERHHGDLRVYFIDRRENPTPISEDYVHSLTREADQGLRPPCGFAVSDLTWRYRSRLLFILKDPNSSFSGAGGVKFINEDQPSPTVNHSFEDFQYISNSPGTEVSAIHCVNKRVHKDKKALGERSERFKLEFSFNTPGFLYHNENGTNTGP
jgi:hypothetical protein